MQKLDPSGFANGSWGGEYGALRDIYNFKNTVNASAALSARAEVGGARTWPRRSKALMLLEIVQTRDTLGGDHRDQGEPVRARAVRDARLGVQVRAEHARRREHEARRRRRGVPVHARAGLRHGGRGRRLHHARRVRAVQSRDQGEGGRALRDGRRRRGGVAGGADRARRVVPERRRRRRARRSTSACTTRTRRRRIRRTV